MEYWAGRTNSSNFKIQGFPSFLLALVFNCITDIIVCNVHVLALSLCGLDAAADKRTNPETRADESSVWTQFLILDKNIVFN